MWPLLSWLQTQSKFRLPRTLGNALITRITQESFLGPFRPIFLSQACQRKKTRQCVKNEYIISKSLHFFFMYRLASTSTKPNVAWDFCWCLAFRGSPQTLATTQERQWPLKWHSISTKNYCGNKRRKQLLNKSQKDPCWSRTGSYGLHLVTQNDTFGKDVEDQVAKAENIPCQLIKWYPDIVPCSISKANILFMWKQRRTPARRTQQLQKQQAALWAWRLKSCSKNCDSVQPNSR